MPLFRGSARSPWFPSSSCCHRCSPFPPREQLLEAVVQGALLVVVVVSPRRLPSSFLSHGPLLPPHEQMLMAGVEGAVVVAVVVVFPSLVRGRCRPVSHFVFLLVISLSSLFRPPRRYRRRPLAPPIHPASSCSLRWEGVLVVLVTVVAGVILSFLFVLVVFLCLRC
jgi:hypothetical protein